ncbi:MAG: hypothetical protein ACM3ZC_13620 [Bacteroidota bacterium]
MLCDACRTALAREFGPEEYRVLDVLLNGGAVDRAMAMAREDILANCDSLTLARLRDTLLRLSATRMIDITNGRRGLVYLTEDGTAALRAFKRGGGRS